MDYSANITESAGMYKGHDEVSSWYLMGSPYPITFILVSYWLFVLKLGPELMKDRPAFSLKNILLIYNLAQVLLSIHMLRIGMKYLLKNGLVDSTCHMQIEEDANVILSGTHLYACAKITELLDTVFFVFRKKQRQVSFLHVYHHSIMASFSWAILKYDPTDTLVFTGTINSFVHVVMYSYYGLSAYPSLTKYLWWKKYITSLQMIQFGLMFLQVTAHLKVSTCPPSPLLKFIVWSHLVLFIFLFRDFYIQTYAKNKESKISNEINNNKENKPYQKHMSETSARLRLADNNNVSATKSAI